LAEAAARGRERPGAHVVIVSGDTGQAIADEVRTGGAAGFLVKPYDIHKLMAIVDRYRSDGAPSDPVT